MILWWSGTSHKRQMSFEDRCMFCSHTEICIELLITSGIFDDVIDSRTKFELAVSVWGQESIHNLLELIQRKRQLFNINEHFNHNQCDFLALLEAWWPNYYSQERRQQLQQFFSKGHDPKNVTPTLYKGNIFTLLWKEINCTSLIFIHKSLYLTIVRSGWRRIYRIWWVRFTLWCCM